MARFISASNEAVLAFDDADAPNVTWTLGSCAPGSEPTEWAGISGPMTVAAAWRELARLNLEDPSTTEALDGRDHWFRAVLSATWGLDGPAGFGSRVHRSLEFDGLATIVEVWLNGVLLVTSESMFVPVRIDVTDSWRSGGNVIELRCLSLTAWLDATTWPRPRWRTRLVPEQRLRNVRTTLLGRIPAWSPPVPPVGPWRAARLRVTSGPRITGVAVSVVRPDGSWVADATVEVDEIRHEFRTAIEGQPWWPWTHGAPALHALSLAIPTPDGEIELNLGFVGGRTIEVDRGLGGDTFAFVVNGERVFVRGAVWMPIDPVSARSTLEEVRARLELARAAGFNMIRISGTTWYEEPHFYDLCDELGLLVWQDLAMANVDPAHVDTLEAEVSENIGVLSSSPCLALVCGSSETEQQATMVGLGPEVLATLVIRTDAPGWVGSAAPDVAYISSTPTGGHLPFAVDHGVAHYYGVGAYLRPLNDARHARVKFAAESLAFSNVPRPAAVSAYLRDGEIAPSHPRWKARVPRDRGVGWDFEDVRDHYVRVLFGLDPMQLRYADPVRALRVGRAAVAEVMARTFAEWRRGDSGCGGALVWCLNDLWEGAGWGVIDSVGHAKSSIGALAPVLAPVAVFALDEGLNGVDFWIANDTGAPIEATLEVTQYRHGRVVVADGTAEVRVPPRAGVRFRSDAVLGRFSDPTGAYRFGPLAHDATTARLISDTGEILGRALHVPDGASIEPVALGLAATATWTDCTHLRVDVTAERLARYVTIDANHRTASHDHVHVEPEHPLAFTLTYDAAPPKRGFVSALNGDAEISFTIPVRP